MDAVALVLVAMGYSKCWLGGCWNASNRLEPRGIGPRKKNMCFDTWRNPKIFRNVRDVTLRKLMQRQKIVTIPCLGHAIRFDVHLGRADTVLATINAETQLTASMSRK